MCEYVDVKHEPPICPDMWPSSRAKVFTFPDVSMDINFPGVFI